MPFGRSDGANCTHRFTDSKRRLLAVDIGRNSLLDSLDTGNGQVFLALAELLIDPTGQDRSHDCRDDNGGGDLGIRGGRKLGITRRDLGEGDRRGHSRAGDSGAGNGRLAVTAAQALESKGDGPTIKSVIRPSRMPEMPPVIKLDRLMDAPS